MKEIELLFEKVKYLSSSENNCLDQVFQNCTETVCTNIGEQCESSCEANCQQACSNCTERCEVQCEEACNQMCQRATGRRP